MIKKISLFLMSGLYVLAGLNHFLNSDIYLGIIPPFLPYPVAINYFSGICEMVFGLMLIPKGSRVMAGRLIIILLFAVFPANVQMMVNYWNSQHPLLWIAIARLPLQAGLIWWAWWCTKK